MTALVAVALVTFAVLLGHLIANAIAIPLTAAEGMRWKPWLSYKRKREIMWEHVALVERGESSGVAAYESFKRACGTGYHSKCHNIWAPLGPIWLEPIDRISDASITRAGMLYQFGDE